MKKFLSFTALLLALMLFTTGCNNKTVNPTSSTDNSNTSKKTIKVALDATYKPMEYMQNNQVMGFDADIIKAIAKETGKEVELSNVSWNDIFDKLYARQYDLIISCVGINDDRKITMSFTDPYFTSTPLIITTKNSSIKSAKDLSKKKVAVQGGTTTEDLITKNIAGVQIKEYTSAEDVLKTLANKLSDAVVIDSPVALLYVKENKNLNLIIVEDKEFFGKEDFGIAANKSDTTLINDINTGLSKIKANGEYQKIFDKYFNN